MGSEFPPRPGTGRRHFVPLGLWGGRAGAGVAQENAAGYWRCLESAFLMSEGGRIKSFLLLFEAVREDACCACSLHGKGFIPKQPSGGTGWLTDDLPFVRKHKQDGCAFSPNSSKFTLVEFD